MSCRIWGSIKTQNRIKRQSISNSHCRESNNADIGLEAYDQLLTDLNNMIALKSVVHNHRGSRVSNTTKQLVSSMVHSSIECHTDTTNIIRRIKLSNTTASLESAIDDAIGSINKIIKKVKALAHNK